MTSVFRELWFTLPPEGLDQKEALIRRVTNITAVVSRAACTSNHRNIHVLGRWFIINPHQSLVIMHANYAAISPARAATVVTQTLLNCIYSLYQK